MASSGRKRKVKSLKPRSVSPKQAKAVKGGMPNGPPTMPQGPPAMPSGPPTMPSGPPQKIQ